MDFFTNPFPVVGGLPPGSLQSWAGKIPRETTFNPLEAMYLTPSNSSDWSDRVNDDLAAFRARNNLRNNPNYVLEVDERLAARRSGVSVPEPAPHNNRPVVSETSEPEDSFSIVSASLSELSPKRNWFGFKQR